MVEVLYSKNDNVTQVVFDPTGTQTVANEFTVPTGV